MVTRISLLGYEIHIARGAIKDLGSIVRAVAPAHRYAIITDDTVGALYGARAAETVGHERAITLTMPPGEQQKTRERWSALTDQMLASGFGRDSAIVALGGGVVCDLAGFVAATFMRGIPVIQVPTTLLAMIDASVGGKTGVDTPAGKNLVGAFHRPAAVVIDPDLLSTLPGRLLRAGLAEAVKHGVIGSAEYFRRVEAAIPRVIAVGGSGSDEMRALISGSVELKANVVRDDERESARRKILNFGHTIGHAIETLSGFSLLHGEAVSIGMVLESRLAERLGIAQVGTASAIEHALVSAELPTSVPSEFATGDVVASMHGDKKTRGGVLELALPLRIGEMAGADRGWTVCVPDAEIAALLASERV